MIQRNLVFCIDNDLKFVNGSIPSTKLTANDINRDVIYVVAPFEISSVVKVKFTDELNQQESVSQLLKYTNEVSVDELVEKTKPYYEMVKDWNVYYVEMKGKPLSFVSNRVASGIFLSFSVVITKPKTNLVNGLSFVGYEYETSLDTPLNNGEYKIIRNPLFEEDGVSYKVDDIIYKENDNYFKISASIRKGGTTSVKYLVEPNIEAIDESLDPTLTEQIIGMVTDLEQTVANVERNAILKDGSVPMEADLDINDNDIVGVNNIEVNGISAKNGIEIEIKNHINMDGYDIKDVQHIDANFITGQDLDVDDAYNKRLFVDEISGNNGSTIDVDADISLVTGKNLGVDTVYVKNIYSRGLGDYIQIISPVYMNGDGIYGADVVEGNAGYFGDLEKGGKEVATIEYVDGMISGVFRPSGNWNANTNTPTLVNNEPTNAGKVYYVTNAGTQFGLTFAVGDKLAFIEGGVATKWDNVDDVVSVNSKVGAVQLNADDIPFNGSGTNYLVGETEVDGAIKELDTRVKANADNVALKVNTSDIIDNLESSDVDKPLSANQGKVLNDTTAKLAVSNVFTQPQQVPSATLAQHAVNKLQVETMFEMFKQQLRGYNLAMPNLSTATDLGGGWYQIYLSDVRDYQYNVINGYWKLNGNSQVINQTFLDITFDEPTDITISVNLISQNSELTQIRFYDASNNTYYWVNFGGSTTIYNTQRVYARHATVVENYFDDVILEIKFEKGDTATPYTVPGQIPQYKIVGEE